MSGQFEQCFLADYAKATQALRHAQDWLALQTVAREVIEDASIVLAEVFNNIIEHAYDTAGESKEPRGTDQIDMRLRLTSGALLIDVYDTGANKNFCATPAPARKTQKPMSLAELPDSGFGLVLIDRLSDKIVFTREHGRNHLHIVIALKGALKKPSYTAQTKISHSPMPPTTQR